MIVISKTKMSVTYNGQPVELSKKTFDLLYYMATKQGILLTREELINNVWEHEFITPRTVDVHIRKLRSKLNGVGVSVDPEDGFIKTILGRGYQLIEKVVVDDDVESDEPSVEVDGVSLGVYKDSRNTVVVVLNIAESKYGNMAVFAVGAKWVALPVKEFKAMYKKIA